MKTKICPKCKVEKPLVIDPPKNNRLYGFTKGQFEKNGGICRECRRKYEQRPEVKVRIKKYLEKFKERHGMLPSDYSRKKKMQKDPVEHLKIRTSNLIRNIFRRGNFTKNSKSAEILGCSYEEFMSHLTNNGEIEYDPKKHHIDHIIPVSLARTEEECIALNHYKNFRLLPTKENLLKKDNLPSILELNPGIPDLAFKVYMRAI